VVCGAYNACDCDDEVTVLDNDLECPMALQPVVEAAMANAADLDLRFYGECLERYHSYLDIVACNTPFEVDGMWEAGDPRLRQLTDDLAQCKLVAGTIGRGGNCSSLSMSGGLLGDTCEHGLVCAEGLCRPWPKTVGDWCGGVFDCPGDLSCLDPDADGVLTCESRAVKGQLCNPHDPDGCVDELYCDGDDRTCASLPSAGKPCLTNSAAPAPCDRGSVCGGEMCEAMLKIGDDCSAGVCNPSTSYCGLSVGECLALPGKGDDCGESGGLCEPGLSCIGTGTDAECREAAPMVCALPETVGVCIYADDGICDEPEGTDLCAEGTDPVDCDGHGSNSDSDSGDTDDSDDSDSGDTDDSDSGDTSGTCPSYGDGVCDEPEGTGFCAEGTDPLDCEPEGGSTGGDECPYAGDGECDEPEGTGYCAEGTDPLDCGDTGGTCPWENDGVCDEPEGTGDCDEGTDPLDCDGEEGVCGDGIVQAGEQCDDLDLQDFTCPALGFSGGTLYCDDLNCTFDTTYCT
jgi:hypothetical protein